VLKHRPPTFQEKDCEEVEGRAVVMKVGDLFHNKLCYTSNPLKTCCSLMWRTILKVNFDFLTHRKSSCHMQTKPMKSVSTRSQTVFMCPK
jgi:hypothetical protein